MHRIITLFIIFSFIVPCIFAKPKTLKEIELAFAKDGYEVVKRVEHQGQRGLLALHKTAVNYETKKRKKTLYVEGNAYQMGFLIGLLDAESVEVLSTQFVDKIVFSFFNSNIDPKKIPILWGIFKSILTVGAKNIVPDLPQEYMQEIMGIVDGCHKANPKTKVKMEDLLLLNIGVDVLVSAIYTGDFFGNKVSHKDLRLPIMCNAFSVFGKATKDNKHYFGRDWMFPTAGILEYQACLTIYNPTDGRIPMVAMSAPGFVGSMVAMNKHGIASGVDIFPGGNCNSKRPGCNSLVLVRHAVHSGKSARESLKTMVDTQRGVAWFYIIADGTNDESVVVEAGKTVDSLKALDYPDMLLKLLGYLPSKEYLKRFETIKNQKGIMARWHNYKYPETFFDFNADLFQYHEKKFNSKNWGEMGYLHRTWKEKNCPTGVYFAPQRENRDDVLVLTNHPIIPSMRLCGMSPWTMLIADGKYDDIQWRYDELNNRILKSYGNIDFAKAQNLIDFLAPSGDFPEYYKDLKKSSDGKTKIINGSVTVANLTDRVFKSHFGFYADEWVSITLNNYVE